MLETEIRGRRRGVFLNFHKIDNNCIFWFDFERVKVGHIEYDREQCAFPATRINIYDSMLITNIRQCTPTGSATMIFEFRIPSKGTWNQRCAPETSSMLDLFPRALAKRLLLRRSLNTQCRFCFITLIVDFTIPSIHYIKRK